MYIVMSHTVKGMISMKYKYIVLQRYIVDIQPVQIHVTTEQQHVTSKR